MSDKPKYYDDRSVFWENAWQRASGYQEYLEAGDQMHRDKWNAVHESFSIGSGTVSLLSGLGRPLRVFVLSGIWCGDCVRQGPVLKKITDSIPGGEIRFIDNRSNPDIQDELRICGAMRVPVAVFLTEDFFELGRIGDRLLGCYRKKLEHETGAVCSTGLAVPEDILKEDIKEWSEIAERMLIMYKLSPFYREKYGD